MVVNLKIRLLFLSPKKLAFMGHDIFTREQQYFKAHTLNIGQSCGKCVMLQLQPKMSHEKCLQKLNSV